MKSQAPAPLPPPLPTASKILWLLAVVVASSLHLAGALAFYRMQQVDNDELGAPGIEIGLEVMSPQTSPTELPPGPESEASVASTAATEQKIEQQQPDLPKETPVESEDPDRLVAREQVEKPREEAPTPKQQQTQASDASIAQEAKAAPSLPDAPQAERSVTPDPGTGASQQRARVTWQKELLAHLDRHKRYPTDRNQKTAEILLSLVLDRVGRVVSVAVLKSSGDGLFDSAAVAMVQRANPVPAPPPLVADQGLSFSLPVVFRARGKR